MQQIAWIFLKAKQNSFHMDLKQMNGFRWWKILGLTHLGIVFPQRRNFVDKNFHPFLKAASQPSSQCFQSGFLAKSLTWENEIWLAAAVKSWTAVVAATARCSLSLFLCLFSLFLFYDTRIIFTPVRMGG